MAFTYGFYNSINGDRKYDAIQFGQIFDGIIKDGIYGTYLKGMVVKASENASEVIVQPGRCWFNHTWSYVDADYPVEAPLPEVLLDRIDALVIDINSEQANRENQIMWVQGTPSSQTPERPTLTHTLVHNQYALAYVYRKAGTTMIYTADITSAVGTSETPFVTGVLEGIDLDAWINQWDDEFHRWEDATKLSFEAWMLNQQNTYTAWYNAYKGQMMGDLSDFEDWFATIQGIIDSEAALHLQEEIDELNEKIPAGSHIAITTSESTLYLRNVTVSDSTGHSKTVKFDDTGNADVESFPYIGTLTVTSTNGERTATSNILTPYYGRYSVNLSFWDATINLTGGTELAGYAVTVKNSDSAIVTAVVLNGSGEGVFNATYPDTYTFSYIYGGETMEVSLAVTQETTYNLDIHAGFNFRAWLTAGRVSGSFNTLDEVLASETTLRQLMLVHDSVDYLAAANVNEDVTKIFNTDLAAKWINLSDYALDKFYAVSAIKTVMDSAGKYGYGEWALMPQVPVMVSNTTPYGTASASSSTSATYDPYRAFNESISDHYLPTPNQSINTFYLRYDFGKLQKVNTARIVASTYSSSYYYNIKLQGSNDASTWIDVSEVLKIQNAEVGISREFSMINTEVNYRYYQIVCTGSNAASMHISNVVALHVQILQFYAWAPKGNVPVMTSDTAPYGSCFSSGTHSSGAMWQAFDKPCNSGWLSSTSGGSGQYLGYKFVNPICTHKIRIMSVGQVAKTETCKLQASNDNSTWIDIGQSFTIVIPSSGVYVVKEMDVSENTNYYLYYRVIRTAVTVNDFFYINELQFYGRELSVSVPKMTSNTAPYGEAIIRNQASTSSYPWYAFDYNDANTNFAQCSSTNSSDIGYVGYRFNNPVKVKQIMVMPFDSKYGNKSFKIGYSDNGTSWQYVTSELYVTPTSNVKEYYSVADVGAHKYWNIFAITGYYQDGKYYLAWLALQFYGLDYSEKEFESGVTKKWIYDHGLKFVTLTKTAQTIENPSDIYIPNGNGGNGNGFSTPSINMNSYSVARLKIGEIGRFTSPGSYMGIGTETGGVNSGSAYSVGSITFAGADLPNNVAFNVSSVTTGKTITVTSTDASYANYLNVKELWLE